MSRHWKVFALYYALTFLLLAFVPIASFLFGVSMDFTAIGNSASEQTGVPWTSNLFNLSRLALAEPGLFLLIFGAAVPTIAALVTLLVTGRFNVRSIVARLNPVGRNQSISSALLIYCLLFVTLVVCLLVTGISRHQIHPDLYPQALPVFSLTLILAIVLGSIMDQGALLEEGGWRGFATTYLQGHLKSPLRVALIIGVCWSLWHLPRDIVSGLPGRLGLPTYILLYLPAFTLGTLSVSVIASYFMNRLGGSVIPAILVHGLVNDATGISGAADINLALTPLHQVTNAIPVMVLAIILVCLAGPGLGYNRND
jgi:hypothetical protein